MIITKQVFKIEASVRQDTGLDMVSQPYIEVAFMLQGAEQFRSTEQYGRGKRPFEVHQVLLRSGLWGLRVDEPPKIEGILSGPNVKTDGTLGVQPGSRKSKDLDTLVPAAHLRVILLQEFEATRSQLARAIMLDLQARLVFEGTV